MSKNIFWTANACMLLLTLLFVSMTGMGEYQPEESSAGYHLQMFIVLTLLLIPLLLSIAKRLTNKALSNEEESFRKIYFEKKFLISSTMSSCIYMHAIIFHATGNQSSLYCALIFMLLSIYTYPTAHGAQRTWEKENV